MILLLAYKLTYSVYFLKKVNEEYCLLFASSLIK